MDRLVSGAWLERELGAPDLRVLDCTCGVEMLPEGGFKNRVGRSGWERTHILGSAHVDLLESLSDTSSPFKFMLPSPTQFSYAMSKVGVGEGTRVVVYDRFMNMWAARLWWMLHAFGFDQAAVLDGGWQSWAADGRPVSTDAEPDWAPVTFTARLRPGVFVGKGEVFASLDREEVRLVSAFFPEQHRGDREDFARPGHIPGSSNVPFDELVDPDTHRYLPGDQLAAAFADVLSAHPDKVITYCGAGIGAASDAFVLSLLGAEDVAIYDGSMEEWAADSSLPIECGE
jgi:thiosulfate/3-mercaptopyruvate sulfurtransferase